MQTKQPVVSSGSCRFVNIVAVIGGLSSAAVTAKATSEDEVFSALVVVWGFVPYLSTALLCYFVHQATWRSSLAFGLLGYCIFDLYVRAQSLYFPTGSTDSLVVLFLPVWAPIVILLIGALSAVARYWWSRPSNRFRGGVDRV